MLAKNYSLGEALWKIPFRIALDFAAAFKALISGDIQFFKAVFKAVFAFLSWIFSRKKNNTFSSTKKGRVNGYYNGSVVWQYFIKKKKTFKEIIH
jgi:hypothetical protein